MNRFFLQVWTAFFTFSHLIDQETDRFTCNGIDLLADGTDWNDSLS